LTTIEQDPDRRPFPGEDLVVRVAGGPDRDAFFDSGRRSVEETAAILASVGRSFSDYRRILDFGCGCGRMITWLEGVVAAGAELHGTDIDPDAIAWTTQHLPFAATQTNDALPPLPYPDDHFDLVYNHSVFTHINEDFQDAWLAELQRVTRPGGHVVLTVHGDHAFSQFEDAHGGGGDAADRRRRFDSTGIVFMADESWQRFFPAWYGATYHATWYVFAHWSRWLRIRTYIPRGALDFQDMILLERRPANEDDPYQRANAESGNVAAAIAEAEALLGRGPDLASRSRFGLAGTLWRRILRLLMRNYAAYERQLDESLVRALRELERRSR
jgi:SAM-dependent methyltransferase